MENVIGGDDIPGDERQRSLNLYKFECPRTIHLREQLRNVQLIMTDRLSSFLLAWRCWRRQDRRDPVPGRIVCHLGSDKISRFSHGVIVCEGVGYGNCTPRS